MESNVFVADQTKQMVEISDDLYDTAKFGYFASPVFHARLRKMSDDISECPLDGRARRRWIEKKLGCKFAEFEAFLQRIADKDGVAAVPIGDMKCVTFDVPPLRAEPELSVTPLGRDVADAISEFSNCVASMNVEDRHAYQALCNEGKRNEALVLLAQKTGFQPLPAGFRPRGADGMLAQLIEQITLDPTKH
jgi:hypothetical protein